MASKSASNFASNWEKVKKELTCAMCKHLLDDPKILPCLHSFCTSCLKEKFDNSHLVHCPSCKSEVLLSTLRAIEELPSHFSAILLVEITRLLEQVEKAVEMCPIHPSKPLEFYCKCKKVMICYNCTTKKHKNHDYDAVSDVEKTLREALPDIQQLVGEVENAIANVKGRRKVVSTRKEENLKKLDDTFRTLHAALDRRQKELKENITKTLQAKDKNLEVQEDELCFLLSHLKGCHSFIEDKVQRGVNQDVLATKRSMLVRDKLKEVKNNTKLYPVEQYPLPIKLKDMDEVVNLISQLTE